MAVDAAAGRRVGIFIAGSSPNAAFRDRLQFGEPLLDVAELNRKACSRMQRAALTLALSDSPSCLTWHKQSTAPLAASWSRAIARFIASRRASASRRITSGSFSQRRAVEAAIPAAAAASTGPWLIMAARN
jgi:hypothetical protein